MMLRFVRCSKELLKSIYSKHPISDIMFAFKFFLVLFPIFPHREEKARGKCLLLSNPALIKNKNKQKVKIFSHIVIRHSFTKIHSHCFISSMSTQ